ncbi:MAG: penicillin-binding protein [Holdemanella sp.]|nr:penicillin-binding protein [Holdemanella sp.]
MNIKHTNNKLVGITISMLVVGTLVVANVLFTMFTHKHIWSQNDVYDSRIASSFIKANVNAKRGTIYDRNYTVIAQEIKAYTIVAYLDTSIVDEDGKADYVKDTKKTAKKLAKVLDLDKDTLQATLDRAIDANLTQTELGAGTKRLDKETMEKVDALNLPGIHFIDAVNRSYPVTPYSSNLIGFASYDEDEQKIVGKMGLESTLNDVLSGKDGLKAYQRTIYGDILPGTEIIYEQAEDGNNVVLTLDSNLQTTVESAMKETMLLNNAKRAWCIVMECETGNILAWASYPTFDQNTHEEIPNYTDNISEMSYEPGSVMKTFTYATALDTGVFPENTKYRAGQFDYGYDPNTGKINRVDGIETGYPTIRDALGNDYGTLTFEDGFAHSSNVGICELLANYIQYKQFDKYLDKFGFFQTVDAPFISEVTGWKSLDIPMGYLSSGFGQASSITVLQLAQAYTAIFNDGKMVKPHVVSAIVDSTTGQPIETYDTEVVGTPITKETANKMCTMMRHVLDEGMSGERFKIDGVDMIAKTGTGEIYDEETHTYSTDTFTSSIMAAAPYDDPKIMVYWGMISTNYLNYSPIQFQQIMQAALIANNINGNEVATKSEEQEGWETYVMPSFINHTISYAQGKYNSMKVQTVCIGDGSNIISQYPVASSTVNSNDRIFLLTDGENITMPNMIGWTYRDVASFCRLAGLTLQSSGSGIVSAQSIEVGKPIEKNGALAVELS